MTLVENIKYIFLLICVISFTGCATVKTSDIFPKTNSDSDDITIHSKRTYFVENYGYYLFGFIPLFCGNPDKPNKNSMCLFKDTVTVDNNIKMIHNDIKEFEQELGIPLDMGQIKTQVSESGSFSAFIIWRKIITTSTIAIAGAPSVNEFINAISSTNTVSNLTSTEATNGEK